MIIDYPPFFNGEILFGYIYRYHIYSGNLYFSETAKEIWDDINKWVASLLFPLVAKDFINVLGMTQDEYVKKHTVMPFYKLFIDENKYNLIIQEMFTQNRYCMHQLFKGMQISFEDKLIHFCPMCIKENYDMPVIFREHNIDGVHVCIKHRCFLNVKTWGDVRKRDKFHWNELDRKIVYTDNAMLIGVAEDVSYILNHEIDLDVYALRNILREKIRYFDYVNRNSIHMQKEIEKFRDSFNNVPKEYQEWIQYITLKKVTSEKLPTTLHPMNYILAIRNLYGSFENFIHENETTLPS